MEILDLKFAGVSLWWWFGIAAICLFLGNAYNATQGFMDDMARRKQFKAEEKAREKNREHDEQIAHEVALGARELGEKIERQLRKEKGEPID
jgi:hypothetical protein